MEMSIEHSFTTLTTMKMRNLRIKRMMKGVVGNNYISIRNIAMNYHDDTLFLIICSWYIHYKLQIHTWWFIPGNGSPQIAGHCPLR